MDQSVGTVGDSVDYSWGDYKITVKKSHPLGLGIPYLGGAAPNYVQYDLEDDRISRIDTDFKNFPKGSGKAQIVEIRHGLGKILVFGDGSCLDDSFLNNPKPKYLAEVIKNLYSWAAR